MNSFCFRTWTKTVLPASSPSTHPCTAGGRGVSEASLSTCDFECCKHAIALWSPACFTINWIASYDVNKLASSLQYVLCKQLMFFFLLLELENMTKHWHLVPTNDASKLNPSARKLAMWVLILAQWVAPPPWNSYDVLNFGTHSFDVYLSRHDCESLFVWYLLRNGVPNFKVPTFH